MTEQAERLRQRSSLRFYLLVFALSVPFWLAGAVADRRGLRLPVPMELPVSALMAVCPLTAAVILVHRQERWPGVRRLLRRVVDRRSIRDKRWYLPIVLLNPAILVASYGVLLVLGRPLPEPRVLWWTAPVLFLVFLLPAVGEEGGWMGYAADPLQDRWGARWASLVMGLLWAVWHVVPLLQLHHPPSWIAWKCLETVAARVLIFWLYDGTGGSVLATVLYHDLSNVGVSLFPNDGSHYDPAVAGILTALAAGVALLRMGRPRGAAR